MCLKSVCVWCVYVVCVFASVCVGGGGEWCVMCVCSVCMW